MTELENDTNQQNENEDVEVPSIQEVLDIIWDLIPTLISETYIATVCYDFKKTKPS